MNENTRPLVSFIVPTLNRGRYVVRAVETCLLADTEEANVDVEVIVLDSESNDGSWEALQVKFGSDDRVVLAQNTRGLGPTRSWLDGARLARGEFLTFLWSDDFISPRFLTALMPALYDGAALSIGTGLIRDLDDESPLPFSSDKDILVPSRYLDGYFRRGLDDGIFRPVSPACSLFSRAVFEEWMRVVEAWCQATPLRHDLHWRRAIGPDLLLFLVAFRMTPSEISVSHDAVVQFSHHEDSFSVAASRLSYETGYWLARLWFLHLSLSDDRSTPTGDTITRAGAGACWGTILTIYSVLQFSSKGFSDAAAIASETWNLWCAALRRGTALKVALKMPGELRRLTMQLVQRKGLPS